ncbi:hypothetical protein [Xenorhabdus bovienii]|uniref:hypothetical protein n=1 Tax=Xenorhabdus bovienii TaxID=40576 RepID=UPI0023B31824|nr:hypothetical protein [Xenorhabdus bovienii]MDE9544122.1 hypothetical protein [Xenorhabdus bovienii]
MQGLFYFFSFILCPLGHVRQPTKAKENVLIDLPIKNGELNRAGNTSPRWSAVSGANQTGTERNTTRLSDGQRQKIRETSPTLNHLKRLGRLNFVGMEKDSHDD